ncbi:G patch domain-containing protein 4 [Plectropomus leopardus]|uniref:G patch domain-containing protein 4 n=1 Tax=Plectropomus leopardus TaxID=160734 RepID=UPI001C4CEDA5|nr:G patch domain-containing protein 4 [Plectropomus leopardus]
MAEVVPEKSRGLKFAEQQLLRHGWEHGKGLGRSENGISEAIKVKVKCDKGGVGHKEGEQFTFHWWDHVFNKASTSLQVESDQNGIQLKKTVEEDEEDGMISNKKPRKATLAKAKLYGCFVKSATLLSGQEQPEPKTSSSDDSSSSDEEDDKKLDLSSTTKLSDADLMKACGGRTAHKGARHGLTMSAKLARLEQQEAEFMAKYGKKSQPASASSVCVTLTPPISEPAEQTEKQEETGEDSRSKKVKKKRSSVSVQEQNGVEVSESPETDVEPKKKKKKKKNKEDIEEMTDAVSTEGDVICVENGEVDKQTKRKHKKKKNDAEQNGEETTLSPAAESKTSEETAELHTDIKVKRKKKKTAKHLCEPADEESNNTESSQSEPVQDCAPKIKKKKAAALLEEAEVPEEEATVKQKRKKSKKDKYVADNTNEEELPPKKKKKKSKE